MGAMGSTVYHPNAGWNVRKGIVTCVWDIESPACYQIVFYGNSPPIVQSSGDTSQ